MVQVRTEGESYLSKFQSFQRGACGPAWIRKIREEGISRFESTGFPNTRHEDWKYTNVAPIARASFTPVWDCSDGLQPTADVEAFTIDLPGWSNLVFLNGVYCPDLSILPTSSVKDVASSLAEAIAEDEGLAGQHLARYVSFEDNGFTALNTAFIQDGSFIHVADGVSLDAPIHLLFLVTAEETIVSHPRNLIILGEGSGATVVESYVGLADGPSFTNTVTEVVLADGAHLDYYKLQRESRQAFHVSTTQVHQGRESQFSSFYLDLGARLGRNNLNVVLDGDGGACSLNGLYITGDRQHIDNHTTVDHQKSYTPSRQLYKGVLDGKSRAVFNGKVIARRGTHQVDAHQTNKNLVLSDGAEVNTKPQLEIFADDLKCSHGATVGQLDEEMIFYMNSRGISPDAARRFLTYGFAHEVIRQVKSDEMGRLLEQMVRARLQDGLEALSG